VKSNAFFKCSIIVAASLWAAGVAAAVAPNGPPDNQIEAAQNIAQSLDKIANDATASKPLEQKCNPGTDDRDSDLCAQWKAADAATSASASACIQTLLSAIGIVGLLATLWFNHRAWQSARAQSAHAEEALTVAQTNADSTVAAVEEARRANAIALDTQRARLRPYLHLESCSLDFNSDVSEPSHVTMNIRNYGTTPAFGLQLRAKAFTHTLPRSPEIHEQDLLPQRLVPEVPPGAVRTIVLELAWATSDDPEMLRRSSRAIVARIDGDYRDSFDDQYVIADQRLLHGRDFETGEFVYFDLPERPEWMQA